MTFAHPALLFGVLLVALPILIHLINRLRYRTVRFAAMEFLLRSQKRNRRRLLLEHLLLLLARCLLVGGIAVLVARPLLGSDWADLVGTRTLTEHVVVLDDSYSTGQRVGAGNVFATAVAELRRFVDAVAAAPGEHRLTLLRTGRPRQPDLNAAPVDGALARRLEVLTADWTAGGGAAGPVAGIEAAAALLTEGTDTLRSLRVFSDFRTRDWGEASAAETLRRLDESGVTLRFVDVATDAGGHLSVEAIAGPPAAVAAGVPFRVTATVRNRGERAAEDVTVRPLVDGRERPAEVIDRIAPDGVGTVSFDVELPATGVHRVAVALPEDTLPADDRRFLAVTVREQVPVLLIDGGRERLDSRFVALALSPGSQVRTGLTPVVRGPEFLTGADLTEYSAVMLFNVARLGRPALAALTEYVAGGGGLAVFLGDQVQPAHYNEEWFAGGAGLFPVPLGAQRTTDRAEPSADGDLVWTDHPVFRVFGGERNSFARTVLVEKRFVVADGTPLPPQTEVVAEHAAGGPLVAERTFGKGRVMAFLTTAGPQWTTWPRNPSYVVAMLLLQEHLAAADADTGGAVGQPWTLRYDSGAYRRAATVLVPDPQQPTAPPRDGVAVQADLDGLVYRLDWPTTDPPGVYEVVRTTVDGLPEPVARAFNVLPAEGDLTRITPAELAETLPGIDYRLTAAGQADGRDRTAAFEPKDWLALALLALLLGEQLLAYRLGFHRKK